MGFLTRSTTWLATLLGAVTLSQAPEFAQQYQQRLGGALDELRIIVADFDRDATEAGLDRQTALALYDSSAEDFLQNRGQSMRRTLLRYEHISEQAARLRHAHPLTRPLLALSDADAMILANAWRDFRPAVPVTADGLAWAAGGALSAGGLSAALFALARRRRRPPLSPQQLT